MGSYLAADRMTAARTSDAQHRSMNPAPSLEQATDTFLTDAERRQSATAPVDIWAAAAGLYGTEGDDGELAWQAEALCAQTDPEAFFPEKGGSTRDAKRVCGVCPVREECLQYAMDNDERFGIWGGLSERERRRLRKQAS
ncbi:WhiB family transcriptional regulator [Rothia mucilaginosa]|uniref:WhiB family transcriptional regulator n=1 Tax=Rothia mucilaginosa TaxID=43675 RepID=UPI0037C6A628